MKGWLSLIPVMMLLAAVVAGLAGFTSAYFNDIAISSNNVVRTITDWYDLAWHWRIPITIVNGGSALTNYQLSITVDTALLVAAAKMQPSGNDIRVTTSDGVTDINYWIDSGMNTSSTVIWIKVPFIPPGSSIVYLYYGNFSAVPASSGDDTFLLFDDFENGFTPGVKWNVLNPGDGTASLSTNAFQGTSSLLILDPPNGGNIGVFADFSPQTACVIDYAIFFRLQGTKELQVQDPAGNTGPRGGFAKSKAGTDALLYYVDDWTTVGNFSASTWYQSKFSVRDCTTAIDYYDLYFYNAAGGLLAQAANLRYHNNADLSTLGRFAYVGTSNSRTETFLDLIKVRSYAYPEPTYFVGVEE